MVGNVKKELVAVSLCIYTGTTMSGVALNDMFIQNPHTGHQELTAFEADVLWEYTKLCLNVKQVGIKHATILDELHVFK